MRGLGEMMKQLLLVTVLSLSGVMFLQQTQAIQCFVCNSFYQLDCADWFDNITHHLVTCQPEQTKCRKIVQVSDFLSVKIP